MATIDTLPNEILSMITTHLDRPRDLFYLSLASRRLSEFAKHDGWKALLRGRFDIGGLDADAYNAVHGVTTLCRNWHRRGLVARYLEPTEKAMSMNTWQAERWRGPQGQTMGYQPSIDSYEEMYGSWGERREVLAWSAGTQIIMRTKEAGANIEKIRKREEMLDQAPDQTWEYDAFKHLNTWFTYRIPDSFEGRDDITRLKLLRPHQRNLAYEDVVFGTASGQLSLLSVSPDLAETRMQNYQSGSHPIADLSLSSSNTPMLATALADGSLSLYPVRPDILSDEVVKPSSETKSISDKAPYGRLWSCEFLSDDAVAVGWGPHVEPIEVYHIGPEGFSSQPLRRFNVTSETSTHAHPTSIYPILPVPSTAQGASEAGHTFLSGGYDGIIRLHDMRSPCGFEQIFWDPTNDSPIYSLAGQGLERIVAGVALHSMIKVFDVRFSGSHSYHTISLPSSKSKSSTRSWDSATNFIVNDSKSQVPMKSGGWNLYLNPRTPPPRTAYRNDFPRMRESSPVYSLSMPSSTSQNLYAGLEGTVQSLTFHGIADTYPDPMLSYSLIRNHNNNNSDIDVRASYNSDGGVLNLGMYEQGTEEGIGMQLLVQDGVTASVVGKERRDRAVAKGLDERWIDLRDERNRWARGEVVPQRDEPPPRPRTGGRGRRRGGRGRG